MLGKKFAELVDNCLQRLDQGEELLEILADHPDYQERIKPLLLVAMASRAFPVPFPNQTAKRMGKHNLMAEMAQMEGEDAFRKTSRIPSRARIFGNLVSSLRSTGLTSPAPNFRLVMVALIMIFGAGFFTLNASAGGNPGDFVNFINSGYQRFLQALSFDEINSDKLQFGQFQIFSGSGLGFDDQVAQKVSLLLDIEDEAESYLQTGNYGKGENNQNKNGQDSEPITPADDVDVDEDSQDNNGLALGHDKDNAENGLALVHDKDNAENGLALGHDKDQDDPVDKDKEDKVIEDKVIEDKIKDKIKDEKDDKKKDPDEND